MSTDIPTKSNMKAILIYSGGMDSTVLLYDLLYNKKAEVKCLSVDYGQRHKIELKYAKKLCDKLAVDHRIADLSTIKQFLSGSSQTDEKIAVPHGHYAEESMKATVVPNRNMLMLALAAAWAISEKYDVIAYAAHGGDHTIYPDCRPEFAEALNQAIELADWHKVSLYRPYVNKTKADLCKLGGELQIDFRETWSCYDSKKKHCGKCGTCTERKEAFALSGVVDPTEYLQ